MTKLMIKLHSVFLKEEKGSNTKHTQSLKWSNVTMVDFKIEFEH